jgi:hypothetical protein
MGDMVLELNDVLRSVVNLWGVDFYGVTDLSPAKKFITDQGGYTVAYYPFAVSIGIALSHTREPS